MPGAVLLCVAVVLYFSTCGGICFFKMNRFYSRRWSIGGRSGIEQPRAGRVKSGSYRSGQKRLSKTHLGFSREETRNSKCDSLLCLIDGQGRNKFQVESYNGHATAGKPSTEGQKRRVAVLANVESLEACDTRNCDLLDSTMLWVQATWSRVAHERSSGQVHISVAVGYAAFQQPRIRRATGSAVTSSPLRLHSRGIISLSRPVSESNGLCGSRVLRSPRP